MNKTYSTTQLASRSSLYEFHKPQDEGVYMAFLLAFMVFIIGIGLFKLGEWAATKNERELLTTQLTKERLTK